MNERAALTKTSENKGKNPIGAKPKENFYESMDSPVEQIFHLQRTIGNQAVQGMIKNRTIQAKLKIGKPNDKYEQEADRVADKVMRMPEPKGSLVNSHSSLGKQVTPLIQRQEEPDEEEERDQEEEQIQAKPLADQITSSVQHQADKKEKSHSFMGGVSLKARVGGPRSVIGGVQTIQESLGVGLPIESSVKSRMGSAFGQDFSSVRIHKDQSAAQLSNRLNARAFTIGNDISFAQGEYQPGTPVGDALIAHELAHTVQQNGGSSTGVPMKKVGEERSALENDADSSAVGAVASIWGGIKGGLDNISKTVIPRLKSGLQLQMSRCGGSSTSTPTATARRVELTGSHALTAYGSDPKINPIWTPGAADHAAAYTSGSDPVVNAEFGVGSSLAGSSVTSVSIRVKEGGNIRGTGTVAISGGSILNVSGIPLTGLTGSSGIRTSNYNFNWEGSADGGITWLPLGPTGPHPVYWLNGTPLTSPLYNFAVSKATGYSAGATGNAAAAAIRHGPRGVDGLTYDPRDPINTDPLSVYADGKGICTDYAN
ncbi:MAG: eCIS core domain-containing protein, partial [Planctomycetota bacterium]